MKIGAHISQPSERVNRAVAARSFFNRDVVPLEAFAPPVAAARDLIMRLFEQVKHGDIVSA